jgi:hypothetical protein
VKAVEDAFAAYFDRQPNDKERQRLMRGRDAAGIKDNDALWTLLLILEQYQTLYEKIPGLIAKAASDVTNNARIAAETELKAAAARTHAELAKSVAHTAADIAGRVASASRWKWISMSFALAAMILGGIGAGMYRQGVTSGVAVGRLDGYASARDERAAAAWANTPEGQVALGLAKAGSLRELAACSGKGWKRRASSCIPKCEKGSVDGWNVAAVDAP